MDELYRVILTLFTDVTLANPVLGEKIITPKEDAFARLTAMLPRPNESPGPPTVTVDGAVPNVTGRKELISAPA